mmetsp:Transcript_88597/g.141029  ORF Transcript_88597/g.141029 Transcript_88597/m.141029 type:complete len:250 (+) Transcript_88597:199-948(+)
MHSIASLRKSQFHHPSVQSHFQLRLARRKLLAKFWKLFPHNDWSFASHVTSKAVLTPVPWMCFGIDHANLPAAFGHQVLGDSVEPDGIHSKVIGSLSARTAHIKPTFSGIVRSPRDHCKFHIVAVAPLKALENDVQIVGLNLRHFVSSSINATLPWWIGSNGIGHLLHGLVGSFALEAPWRQVMEAFVHDVCVGGGETIRPGPTLFKNPRLTLLFKHTLVQSLCRIYKILPLKKSQVGWLWARLFGIIQ